MSEVPITNTSLGAITPVFTVTTRDGVPPFVP